MPKPADGVRSWGRPEAPETIGWHPARVRRAVGTAVGSVAIVAGAVLAVLQTTGWTGAFSGLPGRGAAAAAPAPPSEPAVATCVSIGVTLPVGRFPAEGVAAERVVRLFRADRDGTARVLVPQSFVLASKRADDGAVNLSVLVRSGSGPDDARVAEINGANAEGSLSAAVLYDVDNVAVLDECRGPQR